MKKSIEDRYKDMSRDDIIERCEMYRRQVGGMSRKPNNSKQEIKRLKEENRKLKQILQEIFNEYLESHTWIDSSHQETLSRWESDKIRRFKQILSDLKISTNEIPE